MRRALLLALGLSLVSSASAWACGDKFLIIGRGASYRGRYVAIHPAKILIYTQKAAGNREVDVKRILQRAGHRVDYAADGAQLDAAMQSKAYDFVIVPLDAVAEMERRIHPMASNTVVVPIIFASTDEEARNVEKQYECIARSGAKQRSFLAVLDDAMGMRLKGQPMNCRWVN